MPGSIKARPVEVESTIPTSQDTSYYLDEVFRERVRVDLNRCHLRTRDECEFEGLRLANAGIGRCALEMNRLRVKVEKRLPLKGAQCAQGRAENVDHSSRSASQEDPLG